VKTTGDGMLVEFASVVDAVRCAIEVQRGMASRNEEIPDEQRIEFRVGINVGDVSELALGSMAQLKKAAPEAKAWSCPEGRARNPGRLCSPFVAVTRLVPK
jgi:hypothetical protein